MGSSYCACVNNYNKKNCGLISDIKINEMPIINEEVKKEKFLLGFEEENNFKNKKKKMKIQQVTQQYHQKM